MKGYILKRTETGNKTNKYLYTIYGPDGEIVSERRTDRSYVACTVDEEIFFAEPNFSYPGTDVAHLTE